MTTQLQLLLLLLLRHFLFIVCLFVCFLWRCGPTRAMASSFLRFLDHTERRITFGRTPLDEWSALCRDLYLTTHNTHNRQTSMPPVGFEPTISAGERPQTYALDRAATGTGILFLLVTIDSCLKLMSSMNNEVSKIAKNVFGKWLHTDLSDTLRRRIVESARSERESVCLCLCMCLHYQTLITTCHYCETSFAILKTL